MKKKEGNLKNNEAKIINDFGYSLTIIDSNNLLTERIIEGLKKYNAVFYFNDTNGKHWMFDFKIEDIWFEAKKINICKESLTLNCFK